MIIAHRRIAYHLTRALIWAVFAAAPWVGLLLARGDFSEVGGKWGGAILVSPICAFFCVRQVSEALKGEGGVVWITGDRLVSAKFDIPLSDLVAICEETRRLELPFVSLKFIVFRFLDDRTFRFISASIREQVDAISASIASARHEGGAQLL
jgi:hypothetical protein